MVDVAMTIHLTINGCPVSALSYETVYRAAPVASWGDGVYNYAADCEKVGRPLGKIL